MERCLGRALGVVIINLQQTKHDGAASLRIFSTSDRVMSLLTEGLQLRYSPPLTRQGREAVLSHGLIPYDKEGRLSERAFSCLDLTKGNRIKLHSNHNSQVKFLMVCN